LTTALKLHSVNIDPETRKAAPACQDGNGLKFLALHYPYPPELQEQYLLRSPLHLIWVRWSSRPMQLLHGRTMKAEHPKNEGASTVVFYR